jgi:hypothetical protein
MCTLYTVYDTTARTEYRGVPATSLHNAREIVAGRLGIADCHRGGRLRTILTSDDSKRRVNKAARERANMEAQGVVIRDVQWEDVGSYAP